MSSVNAKSEFEDLIQDEILKSEKFRGLLLSGIIVVMLLAIAINSYYLKVFKSDLIKPFQWFILILLLLLIRSILVRKFQVIWFKKNRRRYLSFLYGNIFFETSIPSVVIIVFASQYNPATALISPIVFFYFIFIILSIFDLDFKLSIFAGFVASTEYLILSLFYYDQHTFSGDLSILNMMPVYIAKSLFLLMAGVVAGFISLKIRRNIFSSFCSIRERNNLEKVFGQQVSKEVVDEFIKNNLKITSRTREATIMFLDIRNFSNFCEGKTPEEINKYQNEVLGFMIDIVKQHLGIVNQILGDGFMATFGAPVEDEKHTLNAVSAANEITGVLKSKNTKDEIPATNVGIGIHCGEVVTGNVGTEDRKQYSVTGNTVILASRLEQLNKKFNTSVIVSKDVIDNIKTEGDKFISLGEVSVKGFVNAIEVYKLS
ncbi:adenylate cyclase 1 [bacterium BMS3Abin03]|nr:adenylate cyclase 1 [bacterium BMS3Abin03]HDZ58802.1 adenylate/guanylate cyclase domain-containing protein [Ignavibacteriales bacterium]